MKKIKWILCAVNILVVLTASAQINAKAFLNYITPDGIDKTGNITLNVSGGAAPYTYNWMPVDVTDKNLSEVPANLYTLRIKDDVNDSAVYYYNMGYAIKWTEYNGLILRNDSMLARGPVNGFPSVVSVNALRPNAYGWAEMVLPPYTAPFLVGFMENPSVQGGIYDLFFAFHITTGNALYAWNNGSFYYLGTCNAGDVIKTGRNATGFYIMKNNVVVYTMASSSGQNIRIKAQVNNSMPFNVGTSFIDSTTNKPLVVNATLDHLKAGDGDYEGTIQVNVSGGSSPYTYKWSPVNSAPNPAGIPVSKGTYTLKVKDYKNDSLTYTYDIGYKAVWSSFNGLAFENDRLYKTGTYQNEGPSATGKNIMVESGWAEMVVQNFTHPYMLGFIDATNTQNIGNQYDMRFGAHVTYDNQFYGYTASGFVYLGQVKTGDVIRIGRTNSNYFVSLNGTVLYNPAATAQNLKLKALVIGGQLANIGCSFNTDFSVAVQKNHASADNLQDGSAKVIPQGGTAPYTISWLGGENSTFKNALVPGKYQVTVQDVYNQQIVKFIDIGVQPSWKIKDNISYKTDSVKLKNTEGLGTLVSNNVSFSGEEAWFEMKMANTSSDLSFGFIGNNRTAMDSGFVPPVFPESLLNSQISLIKGIHAKAVLNQLTYTSGALELGEGAENLFFVRIKNNTVVSLIQGAPSTVYYFAAGDILKIGRKADGTIYFKINDQQMFTSARNVSAKFLLSSIILKSSSSAVEQLGIYTNATEENYSYRTRGSYFCANETCKNWVVVRTFDETGNIASESKQYYDSFGRPTQQQQLSLTEGYAIAKESIYDSYGRDAGGTLPAPLYTGKLCYVPTFFSNAAGQHYSVNDFDKPNTSNNASGERSNPAGVGNSAQGSLGWYYSNNNTSNSYVPADAFPYARVKYSDDPLSRVTEIGDVGRMHKSGSGRETKIYYMDGLNELTTAYRKILSPAQLYTYELDDDFKALTYNNYNHLSILNPHKKVVVNADGHDEITYTTSSGKVLATCTSGYDPGDCGTMAVNNRIYNNKTIRLHLPKEKNTTLKIVNANGVPGFQVNYCNPKLYLYTTKQQLLQGTDYTYNSTTGAIAFLGNYATIDLFLEIAYSDLILSTPPDPTQLTFMESHEIGYTNWTVYYYDVKGRLKAYISPNEFVCQPAGQTSARDSNDPLAFSCDNTAILSRISLDGTKANTSDRLDARIELEPQFNFFNTLKTTLSNKDFQLQSNPALAPKDSLRQRTSIGMISPDSIPLVLDTVSFRYYNNAIDSLYAQTLLDSAFKLLGKRSIRYQGEYMIGKMLANGSTQYITSRPLYFDYTLNIENKKAEFQNNMPGNKLSFYLDSASLVEASSIVLKNTSLKIQVSNFDEAPLSPFNPCDQGVYVGEADGKLLATINANVGLKVNAIIIASPQTPAIVNALAYSKKFYYNEYDHLIAAESSDEGRTNYLYDELEDKLMFSQNDKQKANGGKFSYIKYDRFGRSTESGEFDPTISHPATTNYQFQTYPDFKNNVAVSAGYTSAGVLAKYAQNLPATPRCTETTVVVYDVPYTPNNGQKYLNGKVSYVYNASNLIQYSYDELSRIETTTESFYSGVSGSKTMNYAYNFFGNLSSSVYQKGALDEFTQYYTYDKDQRLSESSYALYQTQHPQVIKPAAKMSYYTHGPLKRKVLGDNLQGLDYVYTIRGHLKSVNNPNSAGTGDPGNDAVGASTTKFADFFSYALDYYPNDYERSGTEIEKTYTSGSFGVLNTSYTGQVKAVRWRKNAQALPSGFSAGPFMYEYNYDELYRLKEANYGTYSVSGSSVTFSATNAYKLEGISYDRNGNIKTLKRYANTTSGNTAVLMDDLTYNYASVYRNRLNKVGDNITSSLGLSAEIDFPNQTNSFNYSYNQIGQVTANSVENQVYEYNSRGLVTKVKTTLGVTIAEFGYNTSNLRQWKKSYNSSGTLLSLLFYIYDASGQEVCTYEQVNFSGGAVPVIKDYNIRAGGRIGVYNAAMGSLYFELTDHLGNVRAVFTDGASASQALVQGGDYYPHGGPLPGSTFVSGLSYRYAYQGQEKDPETRLTNFELRQMDPRLGRWLNPDPYGQHHSPYLAMNNNPVNSIDPDGGQDRPINYFDVNTGQSTNDKAYSNTGVDVTWVTGYRNPNVTARAAMRQAMNDAAAASEKTNERLAWHNEKLARGIKMSGYLRYKAAHQNQEGEWGTYAYIPIDVSGKKAYYASAGGAHYSRIDVMATFTWGFKVDNKYKVPAFDDIVFIGFEEATRSAAHGEPKGQSNVNISPDIMQADLSPNEHLIGPALYMLTSPTPKRFIAENSSQSSSVLSEALSKAFPKKIKIGSTRRLYTHTVNGSARYAATWGRFLGRWSTRVAGPVGVALTAYDLSSYMYEHRSEINEGIQARDNYIQQGLMPLR